ncbi:MAG: AAA family ATPase [Mycoplasma sp.]
MEKYKKRIVENDIKHIIDKVNSAIQIVGPKWCGKTTTARQYCKSEINFQDQKKAKQYQFLAKSNISKLLEGKKPLLIDEWQVIKPIWNTIKNAADKQEEDKVYYFLTGSVNPKSRDGQDSGAGRFIKINMYPMSLYESGDSTGEVSLKSLLNPKTKIDGTNKLSYDDLAYLIIRGGWPKLIGNDVKTISLRLDTYLSEIFESNINDWDGVKKNPLLAKFIAQSFARQLCSIDGNIAYKAIYNDVINGKYNKISYKTVINYIEALIKLFIVNEIPSWASDKRNKDRIRLSPKKMFVDPSLAARLLKISDKSLSTDPNIFGILFENLVARDLQIYMQSLGGTVESYRDRHRNEACDFILNFEDNQFALVEVKLTIDGFDKAIKSLTKVYQQIEKDYGVKPKFMMIISNNDYPSQIKINDECNLYIVPIGCLKN